jgi:3-hydroxyacyl-[acyl-carrier-protein] dehydratase
MYQIDHILKHLPHRFPFLFVDRVISVEEGVSIHAQKCVTIGEDFFNGHFPDKPVMPGVIIIEALAQASGILGFMTMNKTPDSGSIYYFAGADDVRFRNPVVPGDTLELFSKIVGNKRGIWKFDCKAMVGDKEVCSATILCADRPK